MDAELKRLNDLIHLLEDKGEYSMNELTELYISNSFNDIYFLLWIM